MNIMKLSPQEAPDASTKNALTLEPDSINSTVTQENESSFNPQAHLMSLQKRIEEMLDTNALFGQLHADDVKDFKQVVNMDSNHPNRGVLSRIFLEKLHDQPKMFSAQKHSKEEIRALYIDACRRFQEKIAIGELSDREILGLQEGDSREIIEQHLQSLYSASWTNLNKTGSLTLAEKLVDRAGGNEKKKFSE